MFLMFMFVMFMFFIFMFFIFIFLYLCFFCFSYLGFSFRLNLSFILQLLTLNWPFINSYSQILFSTQPFKKLQVQAIRSFNYSDRFARNFNFAVGLSESMAARSIFRSVRAPPFYFSFLKKLLKEIAARQRQ